MAITQRDKAVFFTVQKSGVATRVNADGAGTLGSNTNGATIYTGATTYGSIVTSLIFNSDDTAVVNAYVYIYNGSSVRPLGMVHIPIQSGDIGGATGAAAVDALSSSGNTLQGLPIDSVTGKRYIPLEAGEVLKFSVKAAVTAAKTVHCTALALDGTA